MGWSSKQEVQVDQTLPIGSIGNPKLMDHPKNQPLCLVGRTSKEQLSLVFGKDFKSFWYVFVGKSVYVDMSHDSCVFFKNLIHQHLSYGTIGEVTGGMG